MSYREFIENRKKEYVGLEVVYEGERHKVVDVDYNGALLIDKPNKYNDTTAVDTYMVCRA